MLQLGGLSRSAALRFYVKLLARIGVLRKRMVYSP